MAQQKVKITIPKGYSSSERRAIADDVIGRIIERSKTGKDKNGSPFPGYSDSYASSFDFKLGGKGRDNVNLTLSGEMLNALTLLTDNDGSITIGYTKDDEFNNAKAEGNIKGTYGQKKSTGKKRDFLGVTDTELEEIVTRHPQAPTPNQASVPDKSSSTTTNSLAGGATALTIDQFLSGDIGSTSTEIVPSSFGGESGI